MEEKKLGLRNVISISVGLVIATSCLVSLGEGAGTIGVAFIGTMVVACLFNMMTVASLAELNALMPNTTGGLAQYTLACMGPLPTLISMVGGYFVCNTLSSGVEASIFSYAMEESFPFPIPSIGYTLIVTVVIMIANLYGVDMFAKIQDLVAYLLLGSMLIMGFIGMLGMGTGRIVEQPAYMVSDIGEVVAMTAVAFWLFIGAEYAIPVSKSVRNARRNVPLGMMLGLVVICVVQSVLVLGFRNYTEWGALADSAAPHLLYGYNLLGDAGKMWMTLVAGLAVVSTQNSTVNGLADIAQGMAKLNMLPQVFARTNKRGVPYFGVISISVMIFQFAAMSDDSADSITFLILVGSVFWMISYILAHVDVLILRKRLPRAPRTFKVPCGPLFPILGIIGTSYMVLHISNDPVERHAIFLVTGAIFLLLTVYSVLWIKFKMKIPIFKHVPLEEVMAMENGMYYKIRKKKGLCK